MKAATGVALGSTALGSASASETPPEITHDDWRKIEIYTMDNKIDYSIYFTMMGHHIRQDANDTIDTQVTHLPERGEEVMKITGTARNRYLRWWKDFKHIIMVPQDSFIARLELHNDPGNGRFNVEDKNNDGENDGEQDQIELVGTGEPGTGQTNHYHVIRSTNEMHEGYRDNPNSETTLGDDYVKGHLDEGDNHVWRIEGQVESMGLGGGIRYRRLGP